MPSIAFIQEGLQVFLLILTRIGAMLTTAPFWSSRIISPQVKVFFSLMLSLALLPMVWEYTPSITWGFPYVLLVIKETVFGLLLGVTSLILFHAIQAAGQIIDTQMGFGMVNVLDPQSGMQVPLLGNFFYLFATMLFLLSNGHHYFLMALTRSFRLIPPGSLSFPPPFGWTWDCLPKYCFCFQIALPVAGVLFLRCSPGDCSPHRAPDECLCPGNSRQDSGWDRDNTGNPSPLRYCAATFIPANICQPGTAVSGYQLKGGEGEKGQGHCPNIIPALEWGIGVFRMYRDKPGRGWLEKQGIIATWVPRRSINCQLFAQEKTEPATPRRREEARRKGQVFKSQELASALLVLAAFTGLYLLFPYMVGEFQDLVAWSYSLNPEQVATIAGLSGILVSVILSFVRLTFPLLALVMVVGLLSNVSQTGFILSGEPLRFRPDRINPVEGLKRIFSRRALVQLVKSIAKLAVVVTTYLLLRQFLDSFALALMELKGTRCGHLTLRLGLHSGLSFWSWVLWISIISGGNMNAAS